MNREPITIHHFLTVVKFIKNTGATFFVLTLALWLLPTTAQAQSPTPLEQQCMTAVQGKVAWNQRGDKSWGADNLRNLCQGTTNPSATISCFQNEIRTHNDWSRGITACKAKPVATAARPFPDDTPKSVSSRTNPPGGTPMTSPTANSPSNPSQPRTSQQKIQTARDFSNNTSDVLVKFSEFKTFDAGLSTVFGLASKLGKFLGIAGAVFSMVDFAFELAKEGEPTIEDQILLEVQKSNNKLDGIDKKLDSIVDEIIVAQNKSALYTTFDIASKDIDGQYKVFLTNTKLTRTPGIMVPEITAGADKFMVDAGAISNVCEGGGIGGDSIYDLVAKADGNSLRNLPALHVRIANKFYKVRTLAAYQRYRASYLTELVKRTGGVERTGNIENQILAIEENPGNKSIPFQQIRDAALAGANRQVAIEIEPLWSDCEKAFQTAVTKYANPASVRLAAKKAVEKEFLAANNTAFKPEVLPLLFTDDRPDKNWVGKDLEGRQGNGIELSLKLV